MYNELVRQDAQPSAGRRASQLPRLFRWFSEHCVLRQLDESDVSRIAQAMSHRDFARCWSGTAPRSEADVAHFIRGAQADWMRGTRYLMAVVRKQSRDFVGWIELRAFEKGAWVLRWFVHPEFAWQDVAGEMLPAAVDLMFNALDADKLYANCPRGHVLFERQLNNADFIELVPAGSLDHVTGQPRKQSLYELGRHEWRAARAEHARAATPASTTPNWTRSTELELALV